MTTETKRVLVTGGAGFIGSNIVRALLEKGYSVVVFDNFSTGKFCNIQPFLHLDCRLIVGDLRQEQDCKAAVQGVDCILHQAALGSVPRSVNDPATTHAVNSTGFLHLLLAAKREGIQRIVYASSSSVYGDHPDLPKREEKTGRPLSPYAVTKQTNEMYAKNFVDLYGMELIGLRYFNVFGRNQSPDGPYAAAIPRFIQTLIEQKSPNIFGDGEQSRDFTHIDNVIEANLLAMNTSEKRAIGQVFNVACGQQTTLNELYCALQKNLQLFCPSVADIAPAYCPPRKGDIQHSFASIAKIEEILGYQVVKSFDQGVKESIAWYWESLCKQRQAVDQGVCP